MTRIKPTEKYKEYEDKIRALYAYISANLNTDNLKHEHGKLYHLEPLFENDRLSHNHKTRTVQAYVMADWAEEVQVYTITNGMGTNQALYQFNWVGTLPKAIAGLVKSCRYLDEEGRKAYSARIKQLEDLRATRFDAEGRRI